jgi:putative sterol carrier protein
MADSVRDVLTELSGHFDPADWKEQNAVLAFNITGEGGGQWVARIQEGTLALEEGTAADPDMTMMASDENFLAMVNGDLNPVTAFMQGKVKIKGEASLAMKLNKLLTE